MQNDFYYLSHAICYSYGADKNKIKHRVAQKKRPGKMYLHVDRYLHVAHVQDADLTYIVHAEVREA